MPGWKSAAASPAWNSWSRSCAVNRPVARTEHRRDRRSGSREVGVHAHIGHAPARARIGRDVHAYVVEPGPAGGPINFLAYPVLEIGGKPARAKVEFSFSRSVTKASADGTA